VQEFSQGRRFTIFRPHGRKSSVIIRYFPKQGGTRRPRCIAPIAPVLKAPLMDVISMVSMVSLPQNSNVSSSPALQSHVKVTAVFTFQHNLTNLQKIPVQISFIIIFNIFSSPHGRKRGTKT